MSITIKIKEILGEFIVDDPFNEQLALEVLQSTKKLDVGDQLILDFSGVKLVSPLFLLKTIEVTLHQAIQQKNSLLKGCYLIIKDPSPSIRKTIEYVIKEKTIRASLYVAYIDEEMLKPKVLNLPRFLEDTFEIIESERQISSRKLEKILNEKGEKGKTARERLRLLHRRGLVIRKAHSDIEGKPYFVYEALSLDQEDV